MIVAIQRINQINKSILIILYCQRLKNKTKISTKTLKTSEPATLILLMELFKSAKGHTSSTKPPAQYTP